MNMLGEEDLIIDEKALATMKRLKEWTIGESLEQPGIVAGDDDCDCDCDCKDCD